MDDRYITKTICGEEWLVASPSLFIHKEYRNLGVGFDGQYWHICNCGFVDPRQYPNRNATMAAVAYNYAGMAFN